MKRLSHEKANRKTSGMQSIISSGNAELDYAQLARDLDRCTDRQWDTICSLIKSKFLPAIMKNALQNRINKGIESLSKKQAIQVIDSTIKIRDKMLKLSPRKWIAMTDKQHGVLESFVEKGNIPNRIKRKIQLILDMDRSEVQSSTASRLIRQAIESKKHW